MALAVKFRAQDMIEPRYRQNLPCIDLDIIESGRDE